MTSRFLAAVRRSTVGLMAIFSVVANAQGTVTIVQINAQTGGASSVGLPLSIGTRAYFDHINATGGVNGNLIKLVTLDDAFDEKKTMVLAREALAQSQPIALIATAGAANIDDLITSGFLEKNRLPVIGAVTNSLTARERKSPYVFFARAGIREEMESAVQVLLTLGRTRIAVFYQNDLAGRDALKLIEADLAKRNMKVLVAATYERSNLKADDAYAAFLKAAPQTIIMISTAQATANLAKLVHDGPLKGTFLVGTSFNPPAELARLLGKDVARGIGLVQVMPSATKTSSSLVNEYHQIMNRHGPKDWQPNVFSMEGMIIAKITVEGLRRAGNKPTRESLTHALSTLRDHNLGGFFVNYADGNRLGSRYAEITIIGADGKLVR